MTFYLIFSRTLDYPIKTTVKVKNDILTTNKQTKNFRSPDRSLTRPIVPVSPKMHRSKREASKNASMIVNLLMENEFYKPKNKE